MNFRDIVNRDLVNLQNCESEPIHIPGSIQPHGFLLGYNSETSIIEYCSANSQSIIGISYNQVLGQRITAVLGNSQAQKLSDYLNVIDDESRPPIIIELSGQFFNAQLHLSNGTYILELEPVIEEILDVNALYTQTRKFVKQMQGSSNLAELCQAVANETRSITGFDRVMVYRFDSNYNGEVFAESKKEQFEPFLGLHYPHTDIPVQARELYLKNLLRLIVDVNYEPVPIFTINDVNTAPLDLGQTLYRSVSPIHISYLKNMGVGATLTISLLYRGRLWGLITCHHYSARNISPFTKLAAQLQGSFLTSQIDVRQIAERHDRVVEIEKDLDRLLSQIRVLQKGSLGNLIHDKSLLNLTCSKGVAVMADGILYTEGNVPTAAQITDLIAWLSYSAPHGVYNTYKLSNEYKGAEAIKDVAAGIIYHSLGKSIENCVIWFKPEILKTVNWAGDPAKAIEKDDKGLSPRKSFALWQELRKLESGEWTEMEISAAGRFAYSLQKQLHTIQLEEEETRYRTLNAKLQKANTELESFNWISTHDLKEPLRKIQTFASLILNKKNAALSEQVTHYVERMSASALRMSSLINDILSFSLLRNKEGAISQVDLNLLLKAITTELQDEIAEKKAAFTIANLPVITGIEFQLRQLFLNIIRNALKYTYTDRLPVVTISYSVQKNILQDGIEHPGSYHQITIADNGIGFDNSYATLIFEVFKRLHTNSNYMGTGIGLALCKEIMQNHGGFIIAAGKESEGASFSLYFPLTS